MEDSLNVRHLFPDMVYSSEHPLRSGISGRKYDKCDFVTPIVDLMRRTDGKASGTGMRRIVDQQKRQNERAIMERNAAKIDSLGYADTLSDFLLDEYSSNTKFVPPSNHPPDSLCNNCGTTKRTDVLVGSNGRFVCKCGAEGDLILKVDYKETHDTLKSLARADAPSSSSVAIGGSMKNLSWSVISQAAKRKHNLGNAAEMSIGMADKGEFLFSKGNQRKLTNIIANVDELLSEIGRVDERISRRVRMDAEAVFKESVKHHAKCKKRECQKSLFEKPTGVIARESIVYTIDQLSSLGMEGVSLQTIVSLQQRVRSSSSFNQRDNATQHQSCLAMISALSTSDNSLVCQEVDFRDELASSGGTLVKASSKIPFLRQDSDVQTTYLVKLRDAISRLCMEYTCPNQLRDAAICAMQDNEFVKKLSKGKVVPMNKDIIVTAYIILRSVAEETGNCGQLKNEIHLRRVELESMDVDSMVFNMRSILPKGIVGGTVIDEDELY